MGVVLPRCLAALALLGLAALAGCSSAGRAEPQVERVSVNGRLVDVPPLREAVQAVCTARDQARSDPEAARRAFWDGAHAELHVLARALQEGEHAPAAARLLEAKNQVERDLPQQGGAPAATLQRSLEQLAAAGGAGLEALGARPPDCARATTP